VELLLDADAEVDAVDEDGGTALIEAAAGGHLAVVELLIEAGADVRKKDRYRRRAISYAAEKGHRDIVQLLAPHSTAADRREADHLLGEAPPSTRSIPDRDLWDAVYRGDVNAVRSRLAAGANINATTSEGLTVTFVAAVEGHLDVLRTLVDHGADPNHLTEDGECPLDHAAKSGQSATFDYLLPLTKKKQRETAEWIRRNTILSREWKWHRPEIDERYKQQAVEDKLLRRVFQSAKCASYPEAQAELYKYLSQDGVPADCILADGTTLLMSAAESGNLNVVKRLVEHYHLDPNATNKFGFCALAGAVQARIVHPAEGQRVYDYLYPLTDIELSQRLANAAVRSS
jgi:ankyrin repeat protein